MEKIILYVLKFLAIKALVAIIKVKGVEQSYRFIWLLHYLEGSGEALWVPEEVTKKIGATMAAAVARNPYPDPDEEFPYHVDSSTRYEGSGFWGRPEIFYLVGGFSFCACISDDAKALWVEGVDRYDWHEAQGGGWFTSPLGKGKLIAFFMDAIDFLLGSHGWFVGHGFPSNEPGISNRLWFDMLKVGAAEFDTYIEGKIELSPEQSFILQINEEQQSFKVISVQNSVRKFVQKYLGKNVPAEATMCAYVGNILYFADKNGEIVADFFVEEEYLPPRVTTWLWHL